MEKLFLQNLIQNLCSSPFTRARQGISGEFDLLTDVTQRVDVKPGKIWA